MNIKIRCIFACLIASFSAIAFALPFNIVPNGQLPTTVIKGSTIEASYRITNNTEMQRNNNFVKYLPPHVTVASGGCAANFNLAPHGHPGDSCILNLMVSGAVNGNDPDPHHHLFICFPGGTTCAGTSYPLNVKVVPGFNPVLYGVTGAGDPVLFTLDIKTGFAIQVMPLSESICCGHIIASDGMSLYHWTGHHNPGQIFEKIDLATLTTSQIPLTGFGIDEPFGAVFFHQANGFLYSDFENNFSSVTVGGFAAFLGTSSSDVRGMACFLHHVYGVNPRAPELFEINPVNGAILSTKTITLAGFIVNGAVGLTVNPDTGIFYALLKVNGISQPRKLVTIDIATGVATLIGNADNGTGLSFASIAFNPSDSNC